MKYATLAMVATVAAGTPAWTLTKAHGADSTCVALTATEIKALHVANMTKTLRTAALKGYSDIVAGEAKTTKTALTTLNTCYTTNHITDHKAPTASTDKCADDWNLW